MGKRDLSERQAARVLALLRRRCAEHHEGVEQRLAKELRVSQTAIWLLFRDRTRPSLAMAEALARVTGVSVESVLATPRDRAAELALEAGVPKAAVARVMAQEDDDALPVLVWADRMRLEAAADVAHKRRL